MHEMSITISMLELVREEMEKDGGGTLKSLKIKVGELTAVEPGALSFCFTSAIEGTPFEGARLDIEEIPLTGRCTDCAKEFHMEGFLVGCPKCDGPSIEKIAGDELEIVSMEVL